jgi:CheY-like chemotaxis protein
MIMVATTHFTDPIEVHGVESKRVGLLLVVEDDHAMRSLLCEELLDMGYRIIEATDGEEALQRVADSIPDLILTDLRMPAGGLDYVTRLRTLAPACPIILMTAFGDARTRNQALERGVSAYFDKPVRISDLKTAIRHLQDGNGNPLRDH